MRGIDQEQEQEFSGRFFTMLSQTRGRRSLELRLVEVAGACDRLPRCNLQWRVNYGADRIRVKRGNLGNISSRCHFLVSSSSEFVLRVR